MLNVEVFTPHFPMFDKKGYWVDLSESKFTFRNSENTPLFEILFDRESHENILMTRQHVYFTAHVFICCDYDYLPSLSFKIGNDNIVVKLDENGNEIEVTTIM